MKKTYLLLIPLLLFALWGSADIYSSGLESEGGRDVTFTGQTKFGNGTAAAPSMAFSNFPGLGFFSFQGGNEVGFSLNGSAATNIIFGTGIKIAAGSSLSFGDNADLDLASLDTIIARDNAANTLAMRNGTALQTLVLGQGNAALAGGQIKAGRDASAVVAPGAGLGMLRWEAGTNAGTLKLVAYSGTSTTGVTIVDNVGAGN